MKFVNLETGLVYTLENVTDDLVYLSDGEYLYTVTIPAFAYWYTTEELWNCFHKEIIAA